MKIRKDKKRVKRICSKSLKIAVGSGLAIVAANILGLKYDIFAGTITLLTILTTKWETIRLSLYRVVTFLFSVVVCFLVFNHLGGGWLEYGVFVLIMVFFCEAMGWGATISVNAVIGAHFFTEADFSWQFIVNELQLLLIGITIAVVLSLYSNNRGTQKKVLRDMQYVEERLQEILTHMASYLRKEPLKHSVWADINELEAKVKDYIEDAYEYNNNSFSNHPEYYIDYFEMRLLQIDELHSLHYEMKKMQSMPKQAEVVAEFMDFVTESIGKMHALDMQLERLYAILEQMKQEKLPQSREEFESRAILYHVLMDLEDFLLIKKRFVDNLDEKHRNETFIK
ncbi:MAG: hypothetical protein J6J42_03175 [Lachnospiraceae bacterium]|nr:hypothetical protein [Lachnospiraceae bacterium]